MSETNNKSKAGVTLYDYARRGDGPNTTWSYNVWKTRMALNYKKIPYTTVWLDHNTLKLTLKSLGVPPAASSGGWEYTLPTIQFADDGAVVTDSAAIARELEHRYPETPSLHLDDNTELQGEADRVVYAAVGPLMIPYSLRMAREVIPKCSVDAFVALREKRFGASFEQLQQNLENSGGEEQALKNAKPGLEAVKTLLLKSQEEHHSGDQKKDDGPFIHGTQVCYVDFVLVAMFLAFKQIGGDFFEKVIGYDHSFQRLYDASLKWTVDSRWVGSGDGERVSGTTFEISLVI